MIYLNTLHKVSLVFFSILPKFCSGSLNLLIMTSNKGTVDTTYIKIQLILDNIYSNVFDS